jgi:hypothetical protein
MDHLSPIEQVATHRMGRPIYGLTLGVDYDAGIIRLIELASEAPDRVVLLRWNGALVPIYADQVSQTWAHIHTAAKLHRSGYKEET